MRKVPSFYHFPVEIQIEAEIDVTSINVARRKFETQVGECLIRRTFFFADATFHGAFNLAIEET
jgi:hypothetical protein